MEENPPRVSRKDHNETREEEQEGSSSSSSSSRVKGPTTRKKVKRRFYTVDDDESGSEVIECSGKYCGSCTGGLIADCVAICCCPCALVNLLTLAFVKVPWMIGRKCLRKVVKKKKRSRSRNMEMTKRSSKCKKSSSSDDDDKEKEDDDNGNLRKGRAEDGILELFGDHEGEEIFMSNRGSVSARFEAERVWLELYKDGHLGFGRVSFTGIQ